MLLNKNSTMFTTKLTSGRHINPFDIIEMVVETLTVFVQPVARITSSRFPRNFGCIQSFSASNKGTL